MTGVKIELLIEFGVILLAPIIHTFYLWKYKKVDEQILKQNIRIFAGLYLVLGAITLLILL
jgi:Sec-independent protein secretion pathway component TatC